MYIKITLKCILKMHILGPTSALSKQDIWVEHGGLKFSYTTHIYCKVCEPLDLTHSQIQPKVFVPQNVPLPISSSGTGIHDPAHCPKETYSTDCHSL